MTTQEIKLRLVEAFIAQNTHPDTIPEYVGKLVDYISKESESDIFKTYHVNRESESSISKLIDREKLNEELLKLADEALEIEKSIIKKYDSQEKKLKKYYFSFYDKMEEPERSEAKKNWSYDYCNNNTPETVHGAIILGFSWTQSKQGNEYWKNIYNNTDN
jgi:hypothetical protein